MSLATQPAFESLESRLLLSGMLTDSDFQSGTAFTNATYTAGTSTDGLWYSGSRWVKTANAGESGTGDTAATVTNNWSDLRLFQGITAPASGSSMSLSFNYVRPSGFDSFVRVYGLTSGQQISTGASGTLQGTQLFSYTLGANSSWTSVTNQTFSVAATYARLVVFITCGGDAGDKVDDLVLTLSDTTAPAAINNLATSSPTGSGITLSWTAPGDDGSTGTASGYDIRYSTSAITEGNWASATPVTGEPTPAAAGTNQNMTVSGLNSDTTYYFAIKTTDEIPNTSAISNVPTGKTADVTAPSAISNLTAPTSTSSSVTLNWTAPGDDNGAGTASSYDIRYSTSAITEGNWASATPCTGEPAPRAGGTTGETFTVPGLNASTTYYFAIKTVDEASNTSAISNVVSKATAAPADTTAPTAISNLTAPSSDSGSVTLNWTATGDDNSTGTATTYDIRYSTSPINSGNWASATPVVGEPAPKAAGQAESFTVSGLNAGTTYYFAMTVADEVPNTSALSNVVSKATAAAASNLVTDGDFQSGTTFTNATYTAGTSTDGIWYSSTRWVKTADAGDAGTGDTAATLTNNWGDLRLFQGMAAPANGTSMSLSFKYVHPTANAAYIRVYGLTAGQQIVTTASGTLQGTQLFSYDFTTTSSWASVTNQTFTVSGSYAKLVVFVSNSSDAGTKLDDVVLAGPGGGADTTAPATIGNLAVSGTTASGATLTWTAPGDDNTTGTATTYDIRYSTSPITTGNWASATPVVGEPTPAAAGTNQSMTVSGLNGDTTYYFAMMTSDEVPNTSALSNVPSAKTSDTVLPGTINNLTAGTPTSGSLVLNWTAPGDNGSTGTATSYDIRYSTSTITDANWNSATQVIGEPTPAAAGTGQSMTVSGLNASTTYYFAIKTIDEVPNTSALSNIASGTTSASSVTNLLTNGDFEGGNLTGWDLYSGTTVASTEAVHGGTYAAKFQNSSIRGTFATVVGTVYKYTGWLKIGSETGADWGGLRMEIQDQSWNSLAHSGYFTTATSGNGWFQVGITFTATTTTSRMFVGYAGGAGRTMTAYADDLKAFVKPVSNSAPTISATSVTPNSFSSVTATQTFSVTANDVDGAVKNIEWDFGDGQRAFGASGSRTVGLTGSYTATVKVSDDDGSVSTATVNWSASDSRFPTVTINTVPTQVTTNSVSVSGTATGTSPVVSISTDRDISVAATGTTSWSATVPLAPGNNRLTFQVKDSAGRITAVEKVVRYAPSAALSVSSITPSASSIERWMTESITFNVNNSAATHTQFPYEANPAKGLEWVDGVTVNAIFWNNANPGVTYTRPAFVYQDYQRQLINDKEWLHPQGTPTWTARFAPPSTGTWSYQIQVTEAKGTVTSATNSFTVTSAGTSGNHGPVQASSDPRYFQYADGSMFLGTGTGVGYANDRATYDAAERMDAAGAGNEDYYRWWISGDIWGSSWQAWRSRSLNSADNLPATGLTVNRGYGDGLAALQLDAANPMMMQGWDTGSAGLINGHTYKVSVRWRTEGVTGPADATKPYGATVKFLPWVSPLTDSKLHAALIPNENLDTPWHVSEATFVAGQDFMGISGKPYLAVTLENTTAGAAYVDQLIVQEDLGSGNYGPNILEDGKFNTMYNFEQRRAYDLDVILADAASHGVSYKLVISDKADWLAGHLGSDGLPNPTGGDIYNANGAPTHELQEYYWRYLFARYGASRAVQSWELQNEGDPNNSGMFKLAADLATAAAADGNPHLASTSSWSSLAETNWKATYSQPISYVDFHCYVRGTGFLSTPDETTQAHDSALFFHLYDQEAYSKGFGKPVIWGEMGIDGTTGTDNEDPAIASDTAGIWLHKITWARSGPGGVIPLYWYTDNIDTNNLHHIFGEWKSFMANIPLANGHYVDAAAGSSNTNVRVYGQKDLTNRQAYLWIDNSTHTWWNVVQGSGVSNQSSNITISLGQANAQYTVTWWNTYTGTTSSTQTLTANSSGVLTLAVSNLGTDTAVKITPVGQMYSPPPGRLAAAPADASTPSALTLSAPAAPVADTSAEQKQARTVSSLAAIMEGRPMAQVQTRRLSKDLAEALPVRLHQIRLSATSQFQLQSELADVLADALPATRLPAKLSR